MTFAGLGQQDVKEMFSLVLYTKRLRFYLAGPAIGPVVHLLLQQNAAKSRTAAPRSSRLLGRRYLSRPWMLQKGETCLHTWKKSWERSEEKGNTNLLGCSLRDQKRNLHVLHGLVMYLRP